MDSDETPVLRMRMWPQFEQLPSGEWRAGYPGVGWSVTASSREAAIAELQAEDQRRVESDPDYRERLFQLARHNLADPAPDIETEEISRAEYWLDRRQGADDLRPGPVGGPLSPPLR